ncbi:unnamed protein product [Arabidopsis lyrata]|nr:unnamed protein product [Arabidopsis lyrata]
MCSDHCKSRQRAAEGAQTIVKVIRAVVDAQTVVQVIGDAESRSECCEDQRAAEGAQRIVKIKELQNALLESVKIEAAKGASNSIFYI